MISVENLYEILQIQKDVDKKEIKKAYVRMIRKYPPEKKPDQFQKIREAYEKLIDPIERAEYDAYYEYGNEINQYMSNAKKAFEKQNYKLAIREYKKILIIEPKLFAIKNRMGVALLKSEQYEEAIKQFKEAKEIKPNEKIIYQNLAYVYKKINDYNSAEKNLLKVYELDSINEEILIELNELKELKSLEGDLKVSVTIKKLIALCLEEDISKVEEEKYHNEIAEGINNESSENIVSSINRVRYSYPNLYNLNPKLIEELKEIAVKNKSNLNDTTCKKVNNSNETSSSSGCGILIFCAIIGMCIGGPIGFIIGIVIGAMIAG